MSMGRLFGLFLHWEISTVLENLEKIVVCILHMSSVLHLIPKGNGGEYYLSIFSVCNS